LPFVSAGFQKFLADNNFVFNHKLQTSYLFFYNLGYNKNSHFVDHLVKIDKKVLLNPLDFHFGK
jgi:hypothetical protein